MSEKPDLRDSAWAKPVDKLHIAGAPAGALSLNVEGKQVVGPLQGFGQLWQKTYRLSFGDDDVIPADVIRIWKEKLPEFMPNNSRFYPSITGVKPGEVIIINATLELSNINMRRWASFVFDSCKSNWLISTRVCFSNNNLKFDFGFDFTLHQRSVGLNIKLILNIRLIFVQNGDVI